MNDDPVKVVRTTNWLFKRWQVTCSECYYSEYLNDYGMADHKATMHRLEASSERLKAALEGMKRSNERLRKA